MNLTIEVSVPQSTDIEAVADVVDVHADPYGAQVIVVPTPGGPGPPGPVGDGGFTHVQATPAATWTITNTLGRYPAAVTVVIGDELVDPDVLFPDLATVVIVFAAPRSGRAEII